MDRLVEAVWGEKTPDTAQVQVRNRVSILRRLFRDAGAADDMIGKVGSGYAMRLAEDQRDVDIFEQRVRHAGDHAARGEAAKAIADLSGALALWRGPALDGLHRPAFAGAAQRWDEGRLAALEQRIELELGLGRHAELIGELVELIAAHPWQERMVGQLMTALYRAGRQRDALDHFQQIRRRLNDELGLDPGPELITLRDRILRNDETLTVVSADSGGSTAGSASLPAQVGSDPRSEPDAVRPHELPANVWGFTGRAHQIEALDAMLASTDAGPMIAVIAGTAGVGKTATALHWAHRVAERFPDGQLYINLNGYASGPPVRSVDALARFLRSLGVPVERIPSDEAEAAALYRSLLAGRRILVLLDNARSAEQIRPLLPGGPGGCVLVTSRDRLSGLLARDGARRVDLDVLDATEAEALLACVLGLARTQAEPAATAELARLCACLPLALRIAAANLTNTPRTVADLVAELGRPDRLAALEVTGDSDAAVRRTFDLSYETVPAQIQRMFRLLSLHPGPDISPQAAAALASTTTTQADRMLNWLAGAHLIEEHRAARYNFHDLLRLYAAERAASDEPGPDRRAASRRLYDWYLSTAEAATQLLYPHVDRVPGMPTARRQGFGDRASALVWLEAERVNLGTVCANATKAGFSRHAWLLADALRPYLNRRGSMVYWFAISEAGLAAAVQDGDPCGAASAHTSLGYAHHCLGRYSKAIEHFRQAAALSGEADWLTGSGIAAYYLGMTLHELGRLDQAADHYRRSLEIDRRLGRKGSEASSLNSLGLVYQELGQLRDAAEHYDAALRLYQDAGAVSGLANCMANHGDVHHLLGHLDLATEHLHRALDLHREIGDRPGEAHALIALSRVNCSRGRHGVAIESANAALALTHDNGERAATADALNALATAHRNLGAYDHALRHNEHALTLAGDIDFRWGQAEARIGGAATYLCLGTYHEAMDSARQAIDLARHSGFAVLEGRALNLLAAVLHNTGDHDEAAAFARHALEQHRRCGHRLGEAWALAILSKAVSRSDGTHAASPHWRAAQRLFTEIDVPQPDARQPLHFLVTRTHSRHEVEVETGSWFTDFPSGPYRKNWISWPKCP